jgi:hypothetical protein
MTDATITYLNLGGSFRLDRVGNGSQEPSSGQGNLIFSSSETFLLQQIPRGVVEFQAPFTASGLIEIHPNPLWRGAPDTRPPRRFELVGAGHATADFIAGELFGTTVVTQEFRFRNAVFDFTDSPSPTPEPGTALLLAGGVAAIYRWKRRRDISCEGR